MKPWISYLVCGVQRSGSSLLCEALKNTGLAGVPEEYFLDNAEGREDGTWAQENGVRDRADYLRLVLEKGTTPNGVFGAKVMWNYFPVMLEKLRELPGFRGMEAPQLMSALFPNVHYIWNVRGDKVRQAVSWARAGQTGVYAWHSGENPLPEREPRFDFTFIDKLHHLILEGEAGWRSFFDAAGVEPCRAAYEELVEAYAPTALRILDFLGIPYPQDVVFGERRLQKQADALNEEWVKRYHELKKSRLTK